MKKENFEIGMKFENKKDSAEVGTIVKLYDNRVLFEFDGGRQKSYSMSTVERWWKYLTTVKEEVINKLGLSTELTSADELNLAEFKSKMDAKIFRKALPAPKKIGKKPLPTNDTITSYYKNIVQLFEQKGCKVKYTKYNTVLRAIKRNVAEIRLQKRSIVVRVDCRAIEKTDFDRVKIADDKYGWTLNAIFKIKNADDYSFAVKILMEAYEYAMSR